MTATQEPGGTSGTPWMVTRRQLLVGAGAAVATVSLAACVDPSSTPSGGISLGQFLQMSAILTGYPQSQLNTTDGRAYLEALNGLPAARGYSLAQLYQAMGFGSATPPTSYQDVVNRGVMSSEPSLSLANQIIFTWYAGQYPAAVPGGLKVETFDNTLAWKSITWTQPPMQCQPGGFGAWATPPASPLT